MKLSEEQKTQLRQKWLYGPTAFSGAAAFAKSIEMPNITKSAIIQYIKKMYPYAALSEKHSGRSAKRPILHNAKLGGLVIGDTMHYRKSYILAFVDMYSKKVALFPIGSLNGHTVVEKLRSLPTRFGGPITSLYTGKSIFVILYLHYANFIDRGSEFLNGTVRDYTESMGINHYTTNTYSSNKTSAAERLIRTVRLHLGRRLAAKTVTNFPNAIRSIEASINNTVSSVTDLKPVETTNADSVAILTRQRDKRIRKKTRTTEKFKKGDIVRLSVTYKSAFKKSNDPSFSKELYRIESVKSTTPVSYTLVDVETGIKVVGSVTHHQIIHG